MESSWIAQIGAWQLVDLSSVGKREALKPKKGDEPHWQRIHPGCFVGYRPSKMGGRGTWFSRARNPDSGKYERKALGDYGATDGKDIYRKAKDAAETHFAEVESGGTPVRKLVTVKDACEAYLIERPGKIAEGVFRRHVYSDPVGKVHLAKLRRHHLRAWRKRLEEAPAIISRKRDGETRTKKRAASTVNRDMVPLRAALREVLTPGAPNTDAAWQEALKPARGVDRRRDLYLDREERRRLLNACEAEAKPFVRALCMLPLRPGALAKLTVGDFDKRTLALTIGQDKNGLPRQITVPQSMGDFLNQQSKGKLPAAPIFSRRDGSAWHKEAWKKPIKRAAKAAKLPAGTVAYTLRHCVITDLIRAKLPALTVAQLSGTSLSMIEKYYGHLVRDDAVEALEGLAL